jgi:signal transduction histidine kinase/ligand-binding sensor domain-containing protein/DNA-binding response OmpR family regulator
MTRLFFLIFPILLTFLGTTLCSAQTRSFDKVPTQDGEVNLSVRQVIQDHNGFLWIATFSGLYKYEGDEYIRKYNFINDEQINSDVTALLLDPDNNIWIGTNNGLSKYNPETEKIITYYHDEKDSSSVGSNKIRSLGMDKSGRLLIGTFDAGLYFYNSETDTFSKIEFNSSKVQPPVYIRTILTEDSGKTWIGTLNDGLYCCTWSGSKIDSVCNYRRDDPIHQLSNNSVYCLFKDKDGTIVAGTKNGLNIYDPKTNSFEKIISLEFSNFDLTNFFRTILRDNSGKLWIGTWGGLFICNSIADLQKGNYELVSHESNISNSISSDQIMNVFQDNSGVIWIATEDGLNIFDPYQNQFQPLSGELINGMREQTATAFCEWNNGILILTLADGILFKKENEISRIYEKQLSGFWNEKLYSILIDSKKNIWIGCFSGLLIKINSTDQSVTTFQYSGENIPVYSIFESENGVLLIGTGGGGLKYFNTKTEKFSNDNSLPDDGTINDIHIDSEKNLWIATAVGIFRKASGNTEFEYYLPDNSDKVFNPNIFLDIVETEKGEIFIGGRNGLYIYDSKLNIFNKKIFENSPPPWITNIQIDSKQNMWFNLNFNRIAQWNIETNEMRIFFVNNGIRTSPYNQRGFLIDKNDELYISGMDKICRFKTSDPLINQFFPVPVITKLVINNTEVHAGIELNKQVILDSNIEFQNKIILNNRNKDFTLTFTSTSYLNSKENKYRYILHGYDSDWQNGNEKSAHYANLNPGKYIFEVFSANNDGFWSNSSAKLEIRIKPSPFLSILAIFIYVLITFLSVFQIRKIISARILLKRELLIERVKREKEEKFNQERLLFYTNISHELRTPLTLILGPVKQLIGEEKEGSRSSRLHQLILNNSQRLVTLVNQLLDFRKSIHEGMKLKATNFNLVETIESNIDAFSFMAREKSIFVRFSPESSVVNGWFDQEKLDIILFNILSNAFKYTPENGIVEIGLKIEKQGIDFPLKHVQLVVSNSGKGIPKNLQEKVFERFYQINDHSNAINAGTGIGLSLVKKLVELHHGKITLESEPDKLTRITIYLPNEKEAYSDEEVFDFTRDADRRTKEVVLNLKQNRIHRKMNKKQTDFQKILIVEDNTELRTFLSDYLSPDYKVLIAGNGVEGLEICKLENPDLVISDVMMENMDGMEFCQKIKSTPEISHIPVILMTALASVENKMKGYKVGADDYITKPFEPELLKIRVNNILSNLENSKKGFINNIHASAKELTISKIDEDFMQNVIYLIEKNIDNADFNMDSFRKNIGVSSSQLYRKIKVISGLSPNEFIRTYRLKKAAILIKESNLNISEIAYKVGFNDALYFSKCFKKQFGTSPSSYAVNS